MFKINKCWVGTFLCPRGYQSAWADDKTVCPPYNYFENKFTLICHQLTAFLAQPLFQLVPILSGGLAIGLLGQHLNNIDDRKQPRLSGLIKHAADCMLFKEAGCGCIVRTPCSWMAGLAISTSDKL